MTISLIIILLGALALRLWRINFDLPYIYFADEDLMVLLVQTMLKNRDPNPHFFNYPSLMFYLNALGMGLYYLGGKIVGTFDSLAEIKVPITLVMGSGKMDMPGFFIAGRLVSALAGFGAVVLTFLSGRKLTGKVAVGLLGATLMAVSTSMVYQSKVIAPNIFVVFFVLLAFLGSIGILKTGKISAYFIAGLACGLAASAKYNGGVIIIVPVAAHFLRYGWQAWRRWHIYLMFGLAAAGFILGTPFAILDYQNFWGGMTFDLGHYLTTHPGAEGNPLLWYISFLWRSDALVSLAALLGLGLAIYRRSKEYLLLATFPVTYFVFISLFSVRNSQTILPLTPFLFLLAAIIVVEIAEWLGKQEPSIKRGLGWLILTIFCIALVAWPLQKTIQLNLNHGYREAREPSRLWIEANIPAGSKLAVEPYSPFIDPDLFQVNGLAFSAIIHDFEWYQQENFDYLILANGTFERYYNEPERYPEQIAAYETLIANLELLKEFRGDDFELRIYAIPD